MVMDNLHILAMDSQDDAGEIARDTKGLQQLIDKFVDALVRATDMPRTVILGEQPAGLGASADSEIRSWYDHVHAKQRMVLTPVINRLLEVLLAIRHNRNPDQVTPTEWTVEWNPLWQPTDQEIAQTRLTNAQADQIYYSIASMSTPEIRSRLEDEGTIKDATAEVPPPPMAVHTGSPPGGSGALATVSDEEMGLLGPQPSEKPAPDDLVGVKEAAKLMGVPTRTLTLMIQRKQLPFWGLGNRKQVSMSELRALSRQEADPREDRNGSKKNPLSQPFPEKAAAALGIKYQELNKVAMRAVRRHLIPAIRSGNEARITAAIARVQAAADRGYTDADIAKDAAKAADTVSDEHADAFFAGLSRELGIGIRGTDRPGDAADPEAEVTSIDALAEEADGDFEVAVAVNEEAVASEAAFVDRNVEFMSKLRAGVAAGLGIWIAREVAGREPEEAASFAAKAFAETGVPSSVGQLVVHLPTHAGLIADDQVGTLNLDLNQIRSEAAGVAKFRWITQGDDRVRESHEAVNGQVFTWAEGAPSLDGALPGEEINCRCMPGFMSDKPAMRAAENFVLVV
jgi:SPP1 gp7 family putative phage head morphogenesis protein/excisionase family DNA binding protein